MMTTTQDLWVQTYSGQAVDLLAPQPATILLTDIAHGLSRIVRFNGHTSGATGWTVAEHSVLVEALLPLGSPTALKLAALLHDAHEAYVGDFVRPVKRALDWVSGGQFGRHCYSLCAALDEAIRTSFGLPTQLPRDWREAIHLADDQALEIERRTFMQPSPRAWAPLPEPPPHAADIPVRPAGTAEARKAFLRSFLLLMGERDGLGITEVLGCR